MKGEFVRLISNSSGRYATHLVILSMYTDDGEVFWEPIHFRVRLLDKAYNTVRVCLPYFMMGGLYVSCAGFRDEIRSIKQYYLKYRPRWITLYMCFKEFGGVWVDIFRNMIYYYVNYVNGRTYEEFRENMNDEEMEKYMAGEL